MIRSDWGEFKIEDVIYNLFDGPHATPKPSNTGPIFLGIKNISEDNRIDLSNVKHIAEEDFPKWTKRVLPQKDDLVFIYEATLGRYALIPENLVCCLGRRMALLRLKTDKVIPRFLLYYFNSAEWNQIINRNLIVGATVNRIPIGEFPKFEIKLPSLSSQKSIAKVLSDLDAKIELNNKINAELEAMAKLIYDYWFVQFDFPDENGKPYKSSGGKMVYNEELKRQIPEGWEVDIIGNVLQTDLGGTPSTKVEEYWDGEIPWLNSGEIANFPIIDSELKVGKAGISNSAATLMPKGTCVLSITRHLRPSILGVDSCANQSVVGLFESDKLQSSYIYPYLVNEIPRLMSLRTGAQQPHINKGIVDASFIVTPSDQIIEKYYKLVDSKYKKIINNAFQNQKLAELRDWLLPMLMNGQVRVGGTVEKSISQKEQLNMAAEPQASYGDRGEQG